MGSASAFEPVAFEEALFAALALPGGGKATVTKQRASLLNATSLYLVVEVSGPESNMCRARAEEIDVVGDYKVTEVSSVLMKGNVMMRTDG